MKIIAWSTAGLVAAAAAMTPVPAEAQRYGYGSGYGYDNGYRYGDRRDYRRDRHWRQSRSWHRERSWRGRDRVRCHWVRGYYGRQRQCYRIR